MKCHLGEKKKANNIPLFFTFEGFVYSLYAHNLGRRWCLQRDFNKVFYLVVFNLYPPLVNCDYQKKKKNYYKSQSC